LLKKVVFLDRDGTINRDSPDYIKSREEFEFLPGSLEAINNLTHHGFVIIVVTNQSAVPRKLISLIELEFVHNMMALTVALNGGEIKDVFYCPHMPEDGCDCRKPVLVKSGQKDDVEAELKSRQIRVDYVAKDLYEAAEWVIKNHS